MQSYSSYTHYPHNPSPPQAMLQGPRYYRRPPFRLFWFVLGAGAATWYHRSPKCQERRVSWASHQGALPAIQREDVERPAAVPTTIARPVTTTPESGEYRGFDFSADDRKRGEVSQVRAEQIAKVQSFAKDQLDGIIGFLEGLKESIPADTATGRHL